MSGRKNLKSAEHHYFPRALQKYWNDDQGWVWRLSADGTLDKSKNATHGQIRNAHRVQISATPSHWDESFEYTFRSADDAIPGIIALLYELENSNWAHEGDWSRRLTPQWHLEPHRTVIAEVVASLVVRSPNLRNLIKVMVSDFWNGEAPHWPDGVVPDHLISGNQRGMLEPHSRALSERGKFVILLTDCREFIFGDGLMHNFVCGGPISPNNPRCLVPLTPTIAVAYDCPSSYTVSADFASVSLTAAEVDEVNRYTQIYSGKHIFFRDELPADLSAFQQGKYQQLRYHGAQWFDEMMHCAANSWF